MASWYLLSTFFFSRKAIMLKGFKEFLFRGNVVDLAVAVVIGAAFTAIINSIVDGVINPLIAAVFGKNNLASVGTFDINGAHFSIGMVLDAAVKFVIVAAVVYFGLILPMNKLLSRWKKAPAEKDSKPTDEVKLLTEIRDLLQK